MDGIALANSFFDAVEQNDIKKFDQYCAPDGVMWHAFRPHEQQALAQTGRNLARLHTAVKGLKYAQRRYDMLQNGNVMVRHALTGTTILGKAFEVHMIVHVTIKNGKVSRVEEAVDTAQLQPIYEAMQSLAAKA